MLENKFTHVKNLCQECLAVEVNTHCNRAVLLYFHNRKACDGCKKVTGVFSADITNPVEISLVLAPFAGSEKSAGAR